MQQTRNQLAKVLFLILKITLAILLIWWLWRSGGLNWEILSSVRLSWALAGLAGFQILMILTLAWRWHLLLQASGTTIPFSATLTITLMGQCTSTFTPGSIGIDSTRFYQLFKLIKTDRATPLLSILWDRILGIAALLILTILCNAIFLTQPLPSTIHKVIIGISIFCVALLALPISLLLPKNPLRRLLHFNIIKKIPPLPFDKSTFIIPTLIACATHFFNAMSLICAFYALGEAVPIGASLLLMPMLIITGLIPLTPLGLGISDAVALLLFNTIQISSGANAMMLGRITFVIISACCGLAWFMPLSHIKKDETQNPATT